MGQKAKLRTPPCPSCGQATDIKVDLDRLLAWKGGLHIQDAFPNLSAATRELLLTGFHSDCWSKMIAATEDDDDGCEGHPAGPMDPMGETVYCDGRCR